MSSRFQYDWDRELDTAFLPLRLGDIDPTPAVETECNRIDQHRIRRPELDHDPLRRLHRIQWIDRFVGAEHDEQEEKW